MCKCCKLSSDMYCLYFYCDRQLNCVYVGSYDPIPANSNHCISGGKTGIWIVLLVSGKNYLIEHRLHIDKNIFFNAPKYAVINWL